MLKTSTFPAPPALGNPFLHSLPGITLGYMPNIQPSSTTQEASCRQLPRLDRSSVQGRLDKAGRMGIELFGICFQAFAQTPLPGILSGFFGDLMKAEQSALEMDGSSWPRRESCHTRSLFSWRNCLLHPPSADYSSSATRGLASRIHLLKSTLSCLQDHKCQGMYIHPATFYLPFLGVR